MISNDDFDSSKQCFKILNQKVILLEDEDYEHQTLRNIITASNKIIPNEDRSFLIFDFGSIIKQYVRIRNLMPRVHPFYAIKCMADKQLISLLGSLGAGFDCASWDEITNASLGLPKAPGTFPEKYHPLNSEKIIFSHPFKFQNEMINASKIGVEFTVFDTEEELLSISNNWPHAKLLLRVLPPKEFIAFAQLGKKFGVEKAEIKKLISFSKKLKMNVVGICFHVGSGVQEFDSWSYSIEYCAQVFRLLEENGYKPYLLDIGGGFPFMSMINSETNNEIQIQFEKECQKINLILDKYFPIAGNYVIISEPGSYFPNGSGCIFCQVIGKIEENPSIDQISIDKEAYPKIQYSYILNNSAYHTVEVNSSLEIYSLKEFIRKGQLVNLQTDVSDDFKVSSRFMGYTVDEFDCIIPKIEIPELYIDDWVMFVDKGAYSDVHNDLSTVFCSTTAIPHYYCIAKKSLSNLKSIIQNRNINEKVLKSTNRNDIFDTISNNCIVM